MAYWQLGEKEKGREWYAKALQSVETASQPAGRELAVFRSEASHLLGIVDQALRLSRVARTVCCMVFDQHRRLAVFRGLLVRERPAQQVAVLPRPGRKLESER